MEVMKSGTSEQTRKKLWPGYNREKLSGEQFLQKIIKSGTNSLKICLVVLNNLRPTFVLSKLA
jgi:hypothetical protein